MVVFALTASQTPRYRLESTNVCIAPTTAGQAIVRTAQPAQRDRAQERVIAFLVSLVIDARSLWFVKQIFLAITEVHVQMLILTQVLHLGTTCVLAQRALMVKAARTSFVELVGTRRVLMAGRASTTLLLFQNTVMMIAGVHLDLKGTGARGVHKVLFVR